MGAKRVFRVRPDSPPFPNSPCCCLPSVFSPQSSLPSLLPSLLTAHLWGPGVVWAKQSVGLSSEKQKAHGPTSTLSWRKPKLKARASMEPSDPRQVLPFSQRPKK